MNIRKASSELGRALNSIDEMRGQWEIISKESSILALGYGLPVSFVEKRTRMAPSLSEEEATEESIIHEETKFHVELFYPIIDVTTLKLGRTFQRPAIRCQNFQFPVFIIFIENEIRRHFIKQPKISLKSINLICVPI